MSQLPLSSENKDISLSNPQEKMLNRKEAAEFLGYKENTLAIWACTQRQTIPMYKVGKRIKYKLADLQEFQEANPVSHVTKVETNIKPRKPRNIKKKESQMLYLKWLYKLFKI
jgi:hypothetical protein